MTQSPPSADCAKRDDILYQECYAPGNEAVLVMRKEELAHRKKIAGYHPRSLTAIAMPWFKIVGGRQNQSTKIQWSVRRNDGVTERDKK